MADMAMGDGDDDEDPLEYEKYMKKHRKDREEHEKFMEENGGYVKPGDDSDDDDFNVKGPKPKEKALKPKSGNTRMHGKKRK